MQPHARAAHAFACMHELANISQPAAFASWQRRNVRVKAQPRIDNRIVHANMSADIAVSTTAGKLKVIELLRERALNACSREMVDAIMSSVDGFGGPDGCKAVLIQSSSARAFCSGGDIKALRQFAQEAPYGAGDPPPSHAVVSVFQSEYSLVVRLSRLPVPGVALCDGVWMGFGVGLAGFLPFRVVTERTLFAMPECAIGLWPDVGFALLSKRMPPCVGLYLALTGQRLSNPADLFYCSMATHFVPTQQLPTLRQALLDANLNGNAHATIAGILEKFAEGVDASTGALQHVQPLIEKAFQPGLDCMHRGGDCVQALLDIQKALHTQVEEHPQGDSKAEWARNTLEQLLGQSPSSLAITMQHFASVQRLQGGPDELVEQCMRAEFNVAVRVCGGREFAEGVRAAVVDKDRNPAWSPASVADLDANTIRCLFEPLPDGLALRLDF